MIKRIKRRYKMDWYKVALIITAIGAINWGLHSFNYGLVSLIFGSWSMVVNVV